ncbi:unnamed protein product [Mortierella alpina]
MLQIVDLVEIRKDPPHKYEKGNQYLDAWSASSASHDDQNQESSYNADNGTDHGIEEDDD